jgi:hypothetical protein
MSSAVQLLDTADNVAARRRRFSEFTPGGRPGTRVSASHFKVLRASGHPLIRDDPLAHVALARVGERPPSPTLTSLPVQTNLRQ